MKVYQLYLIFEGTNGETDREETVGIYSSVERAIDAAKTLIGREIENSGESCGSARMLRDPKDENPHWRLDHGILCKIRTWARNRIPDSLY